MIQPFYDSIINVFLLSLSGPRPIRWFITPLIRMFISDGPSSSLSDVDNKEVVSSSTHLTSSSSNFTQHRCYKLCIAFFGLQISYLLWGLLQERIMTRTFAGEKFTNSQFLVFANRFLAMILAYFALKIFYPTKKLSTTGPPLYRYAVISYANCMSTWFQYESLLYISFPVQVLAKSVKTIPVMIAGKFFSGKTYPLRQYLLMFMMAAGIALFLSGYHENGTNTVKQNITTLNGILLLICYLVSSILQEEKYLRK